jgi:hypothetical protein
VDRGVTCLGSGNLGDTVIVPCLRVLPMGWNWALHLCQLLTAPGVVRADIPLSLGVEDGRRGVALDCKDDIAGAPYVDNFAINGGSEVKVNEGLDRVNSVLSKLGLVIHEVERPGTGRSVSGLEFIASGKLVGGAKRRIWRLRFGLETIF